MQAKAAAIQWVNAGWAFQIPGQVFQPEVPDSVIR